MFVGTAALRTGLRSGLATSMSRTAQVQTLTRASSLPQRQLSSLLARSILPAASSQQAAVNGMLSSLDTKRERELIPTRHILLSFFSLYFSQTHPTSFFSLVRPFFLMNTTILLLDPPLSLFPPLFEKS